MELPKGFRSIEEYEFPNIVNICVFSGACTASCVHCPIGITPIDKRAETFGSKEMPLLVFKKITDEVRNFKHSILRIHSVGEPILWTNLKEALKHLKESSIKSWIFTNLITKDIEILSILAESCSIIEVSVNSIDPEDYRKTKGVSAFETVKENISFLKDYIRKNSLKTRLIVSRVESNDKEYDEKFKRFWKEQKVDDAFIRSYHNYSGLIENRGKEKKEVTEPCLVHWARFNIDCDGKAIVCFNELFKGPIRKADVIIGDINKNTIQEIWKGEILSSIREAQLSGDYSKLNRNLPCENCTYCQPLSTEKETSEHQIKELNKNGN